MIVAYHIYWNGTSGGDVDFSLPVATISGLAFVSPSLSRASTYTFAVRAFDTSTQLEEANTQAVVHVTVDSGGSDVTGGPNSPSTISVSPTASGGCRIDWAYAPDRSFGLPDGFQVSLGRVGLNPGPPPVAQVVYSSGLLCYSYENIGPMDLGAYEVYVASYNTTGTSASVGAIATQLGLSFIIFPMEEIQSRVITFNDI